MKTKLQIIFCLVIAGILIQSVNAEESLFSGWLESGQKVTISNNRNLTAYLADTGEQAMIVLSDTSLIVQNGSCSKKGYYRVCQLNYAVAWTNWTKPNERTKSTYTEYYKAEINIFEEKPSISIVIVPEKKELFPQEFTNIYVHLNNTGLRTINKTDFSLTLPDSLEIIAVIECSKQGDTIIWSGPIAGHITKTFSFLVKAKTPGTAQGTARAQYFSDEITGTADASFSIKINENVVKIISIIDKTNLSLGEKSNLTYMISTAQNITVLDLTIESNLSFTTTPPPFTRKDNLLFWDGNLAVGIPINGTVYLQAIKSGEQEIIFRIKYLRNGSLENLSRNIPINVTTPSLIISIVGYKGVIKGTQLPIRVANPTQYSFKRIAVEATTDLTITPRKYTIQELKPGIHETTTLTIDQSSIKGETPQVLTFDVSYTTPYGQRLSQRGTYNLQFATELTNETPQTTNSSEEQILESTDLGVEINETVDAVESATTTVSISQDAATTTTIQQKQIRSKFFETIMKGTKNNTENNQMEIYKIILLTIGLTFILVIIAVPIIFILIKRKKPKEKDNKEGPP